MNAVYSVNNSLFATKDLIFGWSFAFQVGDWTPIGYTDDLEIDHLVMARDAFVGPLYPQELRDAIDTAIEKVKAKTVDLVAKQDEALAITEANAVSPVEARLAKLEYDHQQALSHLAIRYLRSLPASLPVKLAIALLKDGVFELSLREQGDDGRFLTETDCQVTMIRPTEYGWLSLMYGLIPFTK
jgi:hypothetical protein